MKILQIVQGLAPGGAERFVVDLSNELAKTNDVYLFTWKRSGKGDFYRSQVQDNVHQISLDKPMTLMTKVYIAIYVIRLILRIRPDVVQVHCQAFPYIIIPSLLLRQSRYFYTVHNLAANDTKPGVSTWIRKKFLYINIHAVTISKICSDSFKDYYGYSDYATIENGCRNIHTSDHLEDVQQEIASYRKSPNTKVFLNVARVVKEKNQVTLTKIFNKLIDKGFDVVILMIGNKELDPQITKDIMATIKYPDRIKLMGTRNNIPDYLHEVDYFCLPSLWEGLPISLLEAGMSGVYPVVTPVGGMPDVIKNKQWGMLSKDTSEEAFEEAIKKALALKIDKEELSKLYNASYSMRGCADKYIHLYKSTKL